MGNGKKNSSRSITVSSNARNSVILLSAATILTVYLHIALAPALPILTRSYDISYELASWVLSAYMITGAVMSIVIGRLADIYGSKKMFLIVMVLYRRYIASSCF